MFSNVAQNTLPFCGSEEKAVPSTAYFNGVPIVGHDVESPFWGKSKHFLIVGLSELQHAQVQEMEREAGLPLSFGEDVRLQLPCPEVQGMFPVGSRCDVSIHFNTEAQEHFLAWNRKVYTITAPCD